MRASESDRSLICPASLTIPRTRERSEGNLKSLAWGTLVHHWKETGDSYPSFADEKDTKCFNKKLVMTGVERESYWAGGEHEVTFAIRLDELHVERYVPERGATNEDRDAWKANFPADKWLTGTIDYLKPDRLDDLKTGKLMYFSKAQQRWIYKPVPAAGNRQLWSYTMLPWCEAGCPDDWEFLTSITQWPRYPLDGLPIRTYAWVTSGELKMHLAEIRYALSHPNETKQPTDDDEDCLFCDSRPNCPEWAHERI
jgi:hypothetical protein